MYVDVDHKNCDSNAVASYAIGIISTRQNIHVKHVYILLRKSNKTKP